MNYRKKQMSPSLCATAQKTANVEAIARRRLFDNIVFGRFFVRC
jgi:hypothetical protein